jgi:DNA-binding NarL/FixJ family response regulator
MAQTTPVRNQEFTQRYVDGRSVEVDHIIDEARIVQARALNGRARSVSGGASEPAQHPRLPSGLTVREAEVLRLVGAGYTNKEIASELILSVGTVERHLANLYAKIGARSRTEATAFAIRRGLVADEKTGIQAPRPAR